MGNHGNAIAICPLESGKYTLYAAAVLITARIEVGGKRVDADIYLLLCEKGNVMTKIEKAFAGTAQTLFFRGK